ncbi:hypothetical protein GF345_06395 [Candidatus Woesearchaeota archaeon]|nr:hypothetical protein [Candidatus Woesearchaeota archaeon]
MDLESRIESLKRDQTRTKLLDCIISRRDIESDDLDYFAIIGFDPVLERFANKPDNELKDNVIISSAYYSFDITPYFRVSRSSHDVVYSKKLFNKEYSLSCHKSNGAEPPPIPARTHLRVNVYKRDMEARLCTDINFWWMDPDRTPKSKSFRHDGFIYCSDISPEKMHSTSGIALKKTTQLGRFSLGGTKYRIDPAIEAYPLIVLFNDGQLYPYDMYGRKVGLIEVKERHHSSGT